MSNSTRTSEDFIEFTNDDLIEELMRRTKTMVMAMELHPDCANGSEVDNAGTVGMFLAGDAYACLGMATDLMRESGKRVAEWRTG